MFATEPVGKGGGHRHASVLPTRAAERNSQVDLPLPLVPGKEKPGEIHELLEELLGFRAVQDVVGDPGVLPGEWFQVRYEIGVGEESDVEDQIRLGRYSIPVAE